MNWPFDPLIPLRYGVIYADPPWSYKMYSDKGYDKSPEVHYQTMDLAAIKALPVEQLAAPDCALFMWAVAPQLPQALEVMETWKFTFKTAAVWHKKTKHGKTAFGTGFILRSAAEILLVGTIGRPRWQSKSERNLIEAEVREHSRKPEEVIGVIHRLLPSPFKCELFARQSRPGWEVWGREVNKFDAEAV